MEQRFDEKRSLPGHHRNNKQDGTPVNRQALQRLKIAVNPGWLCFVWFGMTAGISLLESPARFAAPALSRVAALDLGRVVFAALSRAELVAVVLLWILVRAAGHVRRLWPGAAALTLIVIAQAAWLLPQLAARSLQIVAGSQPAPSSAHAIYIVLELLKLLLLLWLGFRSLALLPAAAEAADKV